MKVLSLGAGVQSSTLLLMAIEGELEIDAAIFADTGWEPAATYRHLDWLQAKASAAGIPVHRVTRGSLREDALANNSEAWMPLFSRGNDGKVQQLKRQCTRNYKIRPVRRQVRALGGGPKNPVEQTIGISVDEWQRMKDSGAAFVQNTYPLVDSQTSRAGCVAWLTAHGYPTPPKSSCLGCPYRGDGSWREMKATDPEGWADAVDFDQRIRSVRSHIGQEVFVHHSAVPLDEVDLGNERDHGQLDLFAQECDGVCGV